MRCNGPRRNLHMKEASPRALNVCSASSRVTFGRKLRMSFVSTNPCRALSEVDPQTDYCGQQRQRKCDIDRVFGPRLFYNNPRRDICRINLGVNCSEGPPCQS